MVGGHVWQGRGVHGRGACVAGVGACVAGGMHGMGDILRDTVNERAVRILLERILVIRLNIRYVWIRLNLLFCKLHS